MLTASGVYAFAQDTGSVQVDFSVLEQLGQFDDLSDQVELPAEQPNGSYGYRETQDFITFSAPKPLRKPSRSYARPAPKKTIVTPPVPMARIEAKAPSPVPAKKPYWQNEQRAYKAADILQPTKTIAPKPEQRSLLDRLYDSEIKNPDAVKTTRLVQKKKIAQETSHKPDPLNPYKALMVENENDIDTMLRIRQKHVPDILSPKEQDLIQQVLNAPPMRAPADTGPLEPPKKKKRVWKPIKSEPTASQIEARKHVTVHKVLPATSVSEVPKPVASEVLSAPKTGQSAAPKLSLYPEEPEDNTLEEPSITSVVDGAPYPYKKPAQPFKRYSDQLADFTKSRGQKGLSAIIPLPPKTPAKKIYMATYQQKKKKRGVPIMPAVPAPHVDSQPLATELLKTASTSSNKMKDISDYETLPSVQKAPPPAMDLTEQVKPRASIAKPKQPKKIIQASLPQPSKQDSKSLVPRLPPKADNEEKDFVTLPFAPETADLTEEISRSLYSDVVPMMMKNQHWRIQIQAFASAQGRGGISNARRMSLSRALSIRTFLLDQGIEPHRMDVRALGIKTDRTPLDRVDLVFFDPSKK